MELLTIRTSGADETNAVAARLAELIRPGDLITLNGDLGAGKTTFTRGLVAALGLPAQTVTSPTFTLLHEYRGGKFPVYHADAYRLTGPGDAEEIGLLEVIETGDGVTLIEWAERILSALPNDRLDITFVDTGDDERSLTFASSADRWSHLPQDWNSPC